MYGIQKMELMNLFAGQDAHTENRLLDTVGEGEKPPVGSCCTAQGTQPGAL